jgi:CubicO group peptidase (beta-lactamase class C family)
MAKTVDTVMGHVAPGFEGVRDIFARHLADGIEKGAAVAVMREGELVVNLWGGSRDRNAEHPWQENTLVNIFSTTKAVTALCVQRAIDQGLLDLSREVRYYWPEFNRPDKRDTLVSWLLSHRAGLPAITTPLPDHALFDWPWMTKTLVEQTPWWTPGSRHGYHPVTWGWLVGEVFQRAVGVTVGQYLREEITGPLGLDLHIGLSADKHAAVADMLAARQPPSEDRVYLFGRIMADAQGMTAKAMANPASLMSSSNKPAWREMELPSANGHSSARALATLMFHAAAGERLISEKARQRSLQMESDGFDPVLHTETRFGPGFMLQYPGHKESGFGPGARAFGHAGSGGSLAFADPDQSMGFAYVMNQMGAYVFVDPRARALLDEVYRSLRLAT